MGVVRDDVIDRMITRALGEALKRIREDLGFTQSQLVARMPSGLRVKTLASYEQGVRPCTVVRLCEMAGALGVSAADILSWALHNARLDLQTCVLVDLGALSKDRRAELERLREWACSRLATYPESTLARLDRSAIQEMAVLLDSSVVDLVGKLAMFTPDTGE